ncbi:porin family protein [Zunongwangia pacifica]|uniref:Porin family protein n=1 Tax=Zunongwangia pacifica TaxID=2911062 RepID=A0A9X1ZWL8_9FLAO|nr:porin family protein [Zunongwangia pacifica]MCL6219808.1 porin family protein [Zunongwangia pacifica]
MKNSFTILIFILFFSHSAFSQDFSIGLKGGVNYGFGGEIVAEPYITFKGSTFHSKSKQGFNGGVFAQLNYDRFFFRLEGLYNTMQSEFQFPKEPYIYKIEKINVPLLIGYHVFEPFDVYIGPGLAHVLGEATLEKEQSRQGKIPMAANHLYASLGVKAHFGRFEADLRYEHSFTSTEDLAITMDYNSSGVGPAIFTNRRINQITLDVSLILFDSKYRPQKSRSRGCYFR